MSSNRSMFITAYCWMFGSTKKAAAEAFRKHMEADDKSYVDSVIECFVDNAKRAFYDD